MAHGLNATVKRGALQCKSDGKAGIGSRRIFAPQFKLQVLDSYRNDVDCKGNQRATARKYGIHRRQIQKWLQVENNLRNSVSKSKGDVSVSPEARKCGIELALRSCEHRQRDDVSSEAFSQQRQVEIGAEPEHETTHAIGGCEPRDTTVDRRVPDIPHHSPTYPDHQWLNNNCTEIPAEEKQSPPVLNTFMPVNFKCECPEVLPLDFTTHTRRLSPISEPPAIQTFTDAAPIDLSLKKTYIPYPRIEPNTPVFVCSSTHLQHVIHSDRPLPDSQIWDLSTKGVKRPHEDDVITGYSYSSVSSSTAEVKPDVKPVKLFKPYLLDHTDESSNNSDNKSCTDYHRITLSDSETYFYNNNNTEYSYYKDETYPVNIQANAHFYCPLNSDYYPSYTEEAKASFFKKNSSLIKQRQSYSLDFKLSAIQCYYSDEICKGNQRAVATKYKIHRRQVQKWLKQEDQLRQRNETSKHIVR